MPPTPKIPGLVKGLGVTLKTIETEDMPLSYLPGNSLRVRVRMVGDVITL